jgi:hypothetical protein
MTSRKWAGLVQTKSGAKSTDVIMDPEAWKLARGDEQFLTLLDIRRQRSGDIELGPIMVDGNNTVSHVAQAPTGSSKTYASAANVSAQPKGSPACRHDAQNSAPTWISRKFDGIEGGSVL